MPVPGEVACCTGGEGWAEGALHRTASTRNSVPIEVEQ